LILEQWAARG